MTAAAALICPGVAVQLGVGFYGSVSERDPPRNNIEGAYTGLHAYPCDRRLTEGRSDWRSDERTAANIHI